jgi:hypothetical protein
LAVTPPAGLGALDGLLDRASDPEQFEAWEREAKATGWCAQPVRLVGSATRYDVTTGEAVATFASADLPDQVLLKACGNRQSSRCPSCSATYRADAYQLVAAGLQGGKGVPESVTTHPMVFVTLTAPSFGPVHTARDGTACHLGAGACTHGRPRTCPVVHDPGDNLVGQALCPECFDYAGAVVWNALMGELWRRTTIALGRQLASLAGVPRSHLRDHVRVSYTKVVEHQRRGLVHLHAIVRLDDGRDPALAPAGFFTTELLAVAITRAVAAASCPVPKSPVLSEPVQWGDQLDVQPIGDNGAVPKAVAGYVAKYATKSADGGGVLDHRLVRRSDLAVLDQQLSPHLARFVRTAWDLGARPELALLRLRSWAHTLGYRGHFLTKSRVYSTTFGALRGARRQWHLDNEPAGTTAVTVSKGTWGYTGKGWTTPGDEWLAETAAKDVAAARRAARLETATTTGSGTGGQA